MPGDLDLSRAVCRVCGEIQVLSADANEVTRELGSFSVRHSSHDVFRIDVVVADCDTLPQSESFAG